MADYIASMNGPHAESLIHDISDVNHSIIYITENNITGRKTGGSLTDYAVKLLESRAYEKTDYVVNYIGHLKLNDRILRSSTYFIKEEGQLIGLLCTNIDITSQVRAAEMIKEALLVDLDSVNRTQVSETFELSTDEVISKVYAKAISQSGDAKLTVDDRRRIVSELDTLNVFKVKGAISTVADILDVSEKTVYRYINET